MTNITTPFAGNETTAQVQTKLSAIANYWSGTSTALSGAGSWGVVRAILNNFANAANQINNLELASSFITKLNWLNDSDNMFAPLFSSGQQGLWYDPADLTTEFQNSTGTTPVTAAGDAVGLLLDKREGPVPGPELVTNGDFSGGSTDWTLGTGCTVASGEVTFTGSAINVTLVQTGRPSATYNALYRIDYTVISDTLNAGEFRIGGLSGASYFSAANTLPRTVGANTVYIFAKASGTATAFDFYVTSGATSGSLVVDNISVKEIPGNHALQATTSARPILARVPLTGVRNLLLNTGFSGAVSGTPGTPPTSWGYFPTNTPAVTFSADDEYAGGNKVRIEADATERLQFSQSVSVQANTNYIFSAIVDIASGTAALWQFITWASPPAGATFTYQLDGVSVPGSTPMTLGRHTVAVILGVGATAGTPTVRFGAGVQGAGNVYDVVFRQPQVEVGTARTAYQLAASAYDVTEAGIGESWRLLMDSSDDHMDVTLPAITGTMVLATPEGTAAYGFSRGAGSYEIGGHTNGAYFPGTALVGQIVRDGAMSAEEITRTVTFWKAKGGGDDYGTVTDFTDYWRNWGEITSFPLVDTSSGTNFSAAWQGCTGLTSFPLIDTSSGTNFFQAWRSCSSLTSFPLIDTSSGTSFQDAWLNCSGLTSFPLIDTSAGTTFQNAWYQCTGLTSFPLIDTSSGTNFTGAWYGCTGLTSFPLIDTSSGTTFFTAWLGCSGLTSFPLIDTSSGTSFRNAWQSCTSLTSFPLLDTSSGTDFAAAWFGCTGLTSFPLINTSSGTNFSQTWLNCSSLTSFPLIDTSSGTNFSGTWQGCNSLTSFPAINTSSGTNFQNAWLNCSSLTSFPAINTSSGTNFTSAWQGCTSLATFPANVFDTCPATNFTNAFLNTNLSQTSIDNILVSINTAGTSNGTFNQSGGSAPSATGETAIDALRGRGWTVTVTGGY